MTDFRELAREYIVLRRSFGFKLRQHEKLLVDFARYMEDIGATVLTSELACTWATRPAEVQSCTWNKRLSVVRGFARYLQAIDPETEVPPADLLANRYQRPVPYIYTDEELRAIISAAGKLKPQFRAETYRTLLGLLAVTGMRLGETLRLDRSDVDLVTGRLIIRLTKFSKSRELPLHPTTTKALAAYAAQRDRLYPLPALNPSFFISTRGTRLIDAVVRHVFRKLITDVGLCPRAGSGVPRIHDLRHTFTVTTLRDWYRAEQPASEKLPLLSAYLGHVNPVSTYWYLQTDAELLRLAAERLENVPGVVL
ncbi:MAG: tyrosine-type recombinase/integrase [Alicyclobacillus sp.]|nr:tyrosine-type recombinase/integrase [Alicyclobacillus sp.]